MGEVKLAALTTLFEVMVGCGRMLTLVVTVDPAARAVMTGWPACEPRVTSTKASPKLSVGQVMFEEEELGEQVGAPWTLFRITLPWGLTENATDALGTATPLASITFMVMKPRS